MTSRDLPFTQWADVSRTDRFICLQPMSGYGWIQQEDDGYAIYLPPDAADEALGRALLECFDKSRFIWPPPTRNSPSGEGMCRSTRPGRRISCAATAIRPSARPIETWIGVETERSEGRISLQPHKRDKPELFRDLPPDRTVVVAATTDAAAAGAALRLALDRCE